MPPKDTKNPEPKMKEHDPPKDKPVTIKPAAPLPEWYR